MQDKGLPGPFPGMYAPGINQARQCYGRTQVTRWSLNNLQQSNPLIPSRGMSSRFGVGPLSTRAVNPRISQTQSKGYAEMQSWYYVGCYTSTGCRQDMSSPSLSGSPCTSSVPWIPHDSHSIYDTAFWLSSHPSCT